MEHRWPSALVGPHCIELFETKEALYAAHGHTRNLLCMTVVAHHEAHGLWKAVTVQCAAIAHVGDALANVPGLHAAAPDAVTEKERVNELMQRVTEIEAAQLRHN